MFAALNTHSSLTAEYGHSDEHITAESTSFFWGSLQQSCSNPFRGLPYVGSMPLKHVSVATVMMHCFFFLLEMFSFSFYIGLFPGEMIYLSESPQRNMVVLGEYCTLLSHCSHRLGHQHLLLSPG